MAHILITDDDVGMCMMMAEALKTRGHVVTEARTAREAIQEHRENPADLIITDLVMKEMDGTELLRRIRAFSPQTPFIAISGARQGKIYLNMAKLMCADRILAKPFALEVLVQAVDEVLAQPRPSGVQRTGENPSGGDRAVSSA